LKGGVAGGSIIQGVLKVGDEIEVYLQRIQVYNNIKQHMSCI